MKNTNRDNVLLMGKRVLSASHYAKMCFSKDVKKGLKAPTVVERDDSDDLSDMFFIKMVSSEDDNNVH